MRFQRFVAISKQVKIKEREKILEFYISLSDEISKNFNMRNVLKDQNQFFSKKFAK